jgi:pyruvate kinase
VRSEEYAVSLMPFSQRSADSWTSVRARALDKGVFPVLLETDQLDYDLINGVVVSLRQQVGAIISGDRVVFSRGGHFNLQGGTNTVHILEVS